MTNKVQKIREAVEKLKSNLVYGACSSQVAMETLCKEEAYNEVLAILDTMQEEPVSEELEKAAVEAFKQIVDSDKNSFLEIFKAGAQWQEEQMMAKAVEGIAHPDDKEIWCDLEKYHLSDGDKVKVIVIKED